MSLQMHALRAISESIRQTVLVELQNFHYLLEWQRSILGLVGAHGLTDMLYYSTAGQASSGPCGPVSEASKLARPIPAGDGPQLAVASSGPSHSVLPQRKSVVATQSAAGGPSPH